MLQPKWISYLQASPIDPYQLHHLCFKQNVNIYLTAPFSMTESFIHHISIMKLFYWLMNKFNLAGSPLSIINFKQNINQGVTNKLKWYAYNVFLQLQFLKLDHVTDYVFQFHSIWWLVCALIIGPAYSLEECIEYAFKCLTLNSYLHQLAICNFWKVCDLCGLVDPNFDRIKTTQKLANFFLHRKVL